MQAQLHFRTELAQGQRAQVFRVTVTRLPDLEVAMVGIRALDVAHPLGVFLVAARQPGGRQGIAVMVVEIAGETRTVALKLRLWLRKPRP
ncbi:hypothetical protein D3C79_773060 [compost metagenome]